MLSKGQGYITQKEISAESESEGHSCLACIPSSPASTDHDESVCHLCFVHLLTLIFLGGENFVSDGDDDKIVIFGTENVLQHLSEADTFFVDGTFFFVTVAYFSCINCYHQIKKN